MRIFFDTNVLVSAFATRGICADLVMHVLAEHELVVGEVVLAELRRVLKTRIKVPANTIEEIEELLRQHEVVAKPRDHLKLKLIDKDDEWVVASALAGNAEVLVTGDAGLQKAAKRSPVPIATPRQLWDRLRSERR